MALEVFTEQRLDKLLAEVTTEIELNEIEALWDTSIKAERIAALGDLRKNSIKLLKLVETMTTHIKKLRSVSPTFSNDLTEKMLTEIGDIHSKFHDKQGSKRTFTSTDGVVENKKDEEVISGSDTLEPLPTPTGEVLETPSPKNSSKYVALADEYVRFFNGASFRNTHKSKIEALAAIAIKNKNRYKAVGDPINIPWWFIAGIHQLESTYNFKAHLHNGDSLKNRTWRVPAGRPLTGNTPFTWEESARDSLTYQKLDGLNDWSLPRALWRWERYNGFGYRKRGVPSPYLWSFSSIYLRGKYVKDGKFNGGATSAQCGAAILLKALHEMGKVELEIDVMNEPGNEPADTSNPNSTDTKPNKDKNAVADHPFEQFFNETLGDVQHFNWREFLFKGNSHASNGLNSDPPEDLWPNIVPVVRVLDKLRTDLNAPIRVTSAYRNKAYNSSLSGSAKRSQHMAFQAVDIQVIGVGTPTNWAAKLREYRKQGLFSGGIGVYGSFVHIDARGINADW